MTKLLPCPFCGDDGEKGVQVVTKMNADKSTLTRIICRCCGAMCPDENWNKRLGMTQEEKTMTQEERAAMERALKALQSYVFHDVTAETRLAILGLRAALEAPIHPDEVKHDHSN